MMVGRNQAGIDHAALGIQPLLARLWRECADFDDHAITDADLAGAAHGRALQAGKDSHGIVDQNGAHASALVSLSCQLDRANCDSATMAANNATPVSVISNSAANMRGISRVNPASRIS